MPSPVGNGTSEDFKKAMPLLWCPEDTTKDGTYPYYVTSYAVPNTVTITFREDTPGVGDGLSVPASGFNFNRLTHASEIVFLGEGSDGLDWYFKYATLEEGNLAWEPTTAGTVPYYHQGRKLNYLFFDGHVESLSAPPHPFDYRVGVTGNYPDGTPYTTLGEQGFLAEFGL